MASNRSAIAAAVLLAVSGGAIEAASLVKVVGTRTRNNVINDSIGVIVPASGVAAGNSLIVTAHVASLPSGAISCFDARNGAYSIDVASPTGGPATVIASKHAVTNLFFGDVITCNYPIFNGASSLGVYEFTGLEGTPPLDVTAQSASAAAGAASSGLTAATAQPGELVFGFVWLGNVFQSFTPATSGGNPVESPYSPAWTQPAGAGTQKPIYRFVTSVRQYEANGTVAGSGGWIAQVATYRLAPDLCTGVDCNDSNACTADACDSTTGLCVHDPLPAGTSCGDPSSGLCDGPDSCDASGVCRSNNMPDGTACGEVDSDCQLPDTCLAGACRDNGVKPAGTACGDSSSGECDAADTCNPFGFCEANHLEDGTPCGDAAGECANADSCAAGACHDNGFVAAGTACGNSSTGVCDAADSCDGGGVCSPNHVAAGTPCSDGEACTTADACDASGSCSGTRDEMCFACQGNVAPALAGPIAASPSVPFALGAGVLTATVPFTDSPGQVRGCTIDWGDGSLPDSGAVTEPTELQPGSCSGSHLYTDVGVYTISVAVSDPCGESASAIHQYAVVYDPSAGFVTGGGWIDSPPNAYAPNPALTGRAVFGFVSGYFKGNATVPTGRTDFEFRVASFSFTSTSYEWLVVSGAKARFRGTGRVNGSGNYGFALTAWDGQAPGGGGIDRFRIRIWDESDGDAVIYDNQVACPNQGDNADPCTGIGGGSIVLHKK